MVSFLIGGHPCAQTVRTKVAAALWLVCARGNAPRAARGSVCAVAQTAQVSAAVRYSPNFFANSGNAWYKWASVTVPMPFIHVNDNVAFKAFGTIGNQYVERNINYGIPNDNYWDWQLGAVVSVYGFDISAAYTDTNVDVAGCLGTQNCQGRIILGISKAF